ncbi:BirA family transcriptional regulator, biotin operon repressor / biotin---[acetyl-CoA-carboxylase] ligase [Sphingomonas sp. F9_3S_D5_B_2]
MVQLRDEDPPAPMLSLAAGLALIEAVDVAVPGQALSLKWPNDLLLSGRKLAGILLERSGHRVVVGFGVNLASKVDLADRQTASLDGAMRPEAFAPLLAGSFSRLLAFWRTGGSSALVDAWQDRAHPRGTELTVHLGNSETISGRFGGLEPDGALRLLLDGGAIELIRAGDVEL